MRKRIKKVSQTLIKRARGLSKNNTCNHCGKAIRDGLSYCGTRCRFLGEDDQN